MEEICAPDGRTLAWVVRADFSPPGFHFVGGPEHPLQLGVNTYLKGEEVRAHVHIPRDVVIREVEEVVHVDRGEISVDLFDTSGNRVRTLELSSGDTILFVAGGHGIRILGDTRIIEVKQGPYSGKVHDKRFI
ncbi:MAG TPA: hypothetical protein VMS81_01980 [Methanomicrobiales archaeon]|jgi:hypothetical protein|nr:hypothetical protein [Methanomicrobiales archaeon]